MTNSTEIIAGVLIVLFIALVCLLSPGVGLLVNNGGNVYYTGLGGTSVGCSILVCIAAIIIGFIMYSSGTSNVDATVG